MKYKPFNLIDLFQRYISSLQKREHSYVGIFHYSVCCYKNIHYYYYYYYYYYYW
jgi:hypothetical protein